MHHLVLGCSFAALVAPILLSVLAHKLLSKRGASACGNAEEPNPEAPSPSIPPIRSHCDVFLSFRGSDTRRAFTDYLYCGLVDAGIYVFRNDDELRAGENIGLDLLEDIKNSKVLIPIISPNYGSSKWCLDILVRMMECKKPLLPIFYKVERADVQHQIGSFGEAFHYYCYGRRFDPEVVETWKHALRKVSSLPGWESEEVANGHEGELVKLIVRKVLNELKKWAMLYDMKNLVGIDSHVEKVMELVNKSSSAALSVGIHGRGGIGKTALAKAIYNKLFNLFEHRSFIADIRESCDLKGIEYLQSKLISDILGKDYCLHHMDDGINFISSKFKDKKALIILDDVDTTNQLEALAGNPNWFAPGSRIIVTTRDKSILDRAGMDTEYEHKELDEEHSLILFSRHAFRTDSPPSEFSALSRLIVSTIRGSPLDLEVVGSFLCGKTQAAWADAIEKMQNSAHLAVRDTLRISYEALDDNTKQIFLDIACFFIGIDARVASYMWDACGFYPREGIEVLRSFSFISIGDNHELRMHRNMRYFGREIVHRENYNPNERSRLWDYEEATKVLKGNKGTKKIQALYLEKGNSMRIADEDNCDDIIDQGSCIITDEQFRNLPNLRFLHMSDVNLTGNFNEIFSGLRWLKWGKCPPTFAANNFHVRELVILDLSGSSISNDWQGWSSIMIAEELKVLNLTSCRSLKSTFYLSAFKRLEILILRDCVELEQIDPCIEDVKTLISLDLRGCSCLKELPPQIGKLEQLKELLLDQTMIREIPSSYSSLKKLETLSAKDCKLLHQLPDWICCLVKLSTLVLSGCVELVALPDSIRFLVNLRCLSLGCCDQLREIPNSIGELKLLTQLHLTGCSRLEKLPPELSKLEQLKELLLDQTMIREIPNSIGELKLLTQLHLSGCLHFEKLPPQMGKLEQLKELRLDQTMIREIPSSIGSLKKLEMLCAKDCKSLRRLPDSIHGLVNLSTLVLSGCVQLAALPHNIGSLVKLRRLSLGRCHRLREIPNSIGELKLLTQLELSGCLCIEELPLQMGKLEQLKELFLDRTMIQEIPSSIGSLEKLETLSAKDCKLLLRLSDSICGLVNLSTLVFSGCVELVELPDSIGFLMNLRCLSLGCCYQLRGIPTSIGKLKLLTQLDLSGCSCFEELPLQMGKLEQLKELLLDQTMIQEIPSCIGSLKKLETLSAKDCKLLGRLPHSIRHLENLSTLVLSGCVKLVALPRSIGCILNLRCLSLERCHQLRMIPNSIGKLKLLTQLDLSGCSRLEELPPQMGKLEQLKELLLDQTMIREIPSSIGSLEKLEKLSVKDWKLLHQLPDSIHCLVNLSTLVLSGCVELAALPHSIGFLVNLRYLSLGQCHQLREIPNSIGELKLLTQLDLSGCSYLTELPPQMGELEHLEELLLDRTRIQEIPSFIGSLKKLEMLSAKDCKLLRQLPDSIRGLVNLLTLDVSGCVELPALPDSIGFLVNLRCLSLGSCHRLREIPNSVGELKLLTQLDLSWTTITELPKSIGDLQNLEVLNTDHSSIGKLPDGIGRLKKL